MEANPYFVQVRENLKWLKERKENKTIPLSLENFRAEDLQYREDSKRFDLLDKFESPLAYVSPQHEKPLHEKPTPRWLGNKAQSMAQRTEKETATLEAAGNVLVGNETIASPRVVHAADTHFSIDKYKYLRHTYYG